MTDIKQQTVPATARQLAQILSRRHPTIVEMFSGMCRLPT